MPNLPLPIPAPIAGSALRLALLIGAVYAVLGAAWILGSDALVLSLSADPAWLVLAQRYKGLAYVALTSAALVAMVAAGYRRLQRVSDESAGHALRVNDLFQQHPQPMWYHDPVSLAFLRVNDAAVRQYGHPAAEFVGLTLADIRLPDDTVAPPLPPAQAPDLQLERHRRRSGDIRFMQVSTQPALLAGRPAVLVLAIDVTATVQARQALQRQESQYRQLHQSLGEVLWLATADGQRMLYVSPACEAVYGLSVAEFSATPDRWLERVHPDDRAQAQASGERLMREGQASCEYRIRRPDGSERWIADRKRLVLDDAGQAVMIGGIAEDITQAKQAQAALQHSAGELLQRNAELERFNRAAVGRELAMVELKREVNALAVAQGLAPRHRVDFADALHDGTASRPPAPPP